MNRGLSPGCGCGDHKQKQSDMAGGEAGIGLVGVGEGTGRMAGEASQPGLPTALITVLTCAPTRNAM